ncbi:lysine--tRNA ligase, partial [Candidatus Kaiserbacteria bacterium]|nr:lysine--tRNA ligase [Candidatus Kaiserbacteria bacterium]
WRILTKSLQPIPTEHFGLKDEDLRFRKRYLDLLQDEEAREIFFKKAKFWDVIRSFMKGHGFLEVETPTLEVTT